MRATEKDLVLSSGFDRRTKLREGSWSASPSETKLLSFFGHGMGTLEMYQVFLTTKKQGDPPKAKSFVLVSILLTMAELGHGWFSIKLTCGRFS